MYKFLYQMKIHTNINYKEHLSAKTKSNYNAIKLCQSAYQIAQSLLADWTPT